MPYPPIVFGFILIALIAAGLIVGSSVAATYFSRKLRLRSEEISRGRGVAIGIVWLVGGLLTGAMFAALIGLAAN